MHAAALPLLFVLGAGKLVGVLGATGQGAAVRLPGRPPTRAPGRGARSPPEIPSHPAQVYEAILVGLAIAGLAALGRVEVVARRDGAALFVALGLWAIARFLVAFTWRDPAVLGPLAHGAAARHRRAGHRRPRACSSGRARRSRRRSSGGSTSRPASA